MSLSDVLALVFGAFSILTTLGLAFVWVGQQKGKREEMERRLLALETKQTPDPSARIDAIEARQRDHDDMREVIARLEERMTSLALTLNRQPEMIGQVVAAVLKETLRARAA